MVSVPRRIPLSPTHSFREPAAPASRNRYKRENPLSEIREGVNGRSTEVVYATMSIFDRFRRRRAASDAFLRRLTEGFM